MTFLIVIRDRETNHKRTFEVGIDPNLVNITAESDAIYSIRSAHALWDRQRYPLHKLGVVMNGTRRHDEVVEL